MYINASFVTTRFKGNELADLTGIDSQINNEVIDVAIQQAEDEVNFYLQQKYIVPLVTVPNLIKEIMFDLTKYNLYARQFDDKFPETTEKKREERIKLLEKIANGSFSVNELVSNITESSNRAVYSKKNTKIFTDDRLKSAFNV